MEEAALLDLEPLPQSSQELPLHQFARVHFTALLLALALLFCSCAIGTRCPYRPCQRSHRDVDQGQARDINGVHQHQQQGGNIGVYHDNPSTTFIYGSSYNVLLIVIDISRMVEDEHQDQDAAASYEERDDPTILQAARQPERRHVGRR